METMASNLEEARRSRRVGRLALALGAMSGPVALLVAFAADSIMAACGAAGLILAVQVAMLVPMARRGGRGKGTRLIVAGIVTTLAWSGLVIYLVARAAAHWASLGSLSFPGGHV
ncbi:MAG: hypothetical protein NTV86_19160 [Planctomycetota bacterium]|nr:hypothetical protein [Planctomycetota bacterium]